MDRRLLDIGLIGTVVTAVCCATLVPVVITAKGGGRILVAVIVHAGAGEMLPETTLAMKAGLISRKSPARSTAFGGERRRLAPGYGDEDGGAHHRRRAPGAGRHRLSACA
jgi:hypothetical protein